MSLFVALMWLIKISLCMAVPSQVCKYHPEGDVSMD